MQALSFPLTKQRACELNSACFTTNCTLVTSQYGDGMTSLSVTEAPVDDEDEQTTYDLTSEFLIFNRLTLILVLDF